MAIDGNRVFIADWIGGVTAVDISNPASIVEIDTYQTPDKARDVQVANGYIYVADYESGLRVLILN
jgi:hypothetical protein